jgi:hypothetical protein
MISISPWMLVVYRANVLFLLLYILICEQSPLRRFRVFVRIAILAAIIASAWASVFAFGGHTEVPPAHSTSATEYLADNSCCDFGSDSGRQTFAY